MGELLSMAKKSPNEQFLVYSQQLARLHRVVN